MARKTEASGLLAVISVMEVTDALKGQRVCITGHLSAVRKDVEAIIVQAGGTVQNDVHGDTTILVTNQDWTATNLTGGKKSSKMVKAEANNRWSSAGKPRTRIMNEEQFLQHIIDNGKTSSILTD